MDQGGRALQSHGVNKDMERCCYPRGGDWVCGGKDGVRVGEMPSGAALSGALSLGRSTRSGGSRPPINPSPEDPVPSSVPSYGIHRHRPHMSKPTE